MVPENRIALEQPDVSHLRIRRFQTFRAGSEKLCIGSGRGLAKNVGKGLSYLRAKFGVCSTNHVLSGLFRAIGPIRPRLQLVVRIKFSVRGNCPGLSTLFIYFIDEPVIICVRSDVILRSAR